MSINLKKSIYIWLIAFLPLILQPENELPLHKKKLSDKVLVVWTGDYIQTIAVLALSSREGIVVIDTSLCRTLDGKARQVIEEEFGRKDFKYLINTHYHHDHTCGNQIYSDATIVAHKKVPKGMKNELSGKGLIDLIDKFRGMLKGGEEALKTEEPQSERYKYIREFIKYLRIAIQDLTQGFIPTYPTLLFEKSLILDMGDMTVELYSFIRGHTDSDIMIFVPEEGLVALGDVTPEHMLPSVSKEMEAYFPDTMDHWGKIINGGREIKYVHMAHSNMHLTAATFIEQYRYLHALWLGVSEMYLEGLTLDQVKMKVTIDDNFPYFKDKIIETRSGNIHEKNIEIIWERMVEK